MIIDKTGKIFSAWWDGDGPVTEDFSEKYQVRFFIGDYYTKEQKEQFLAIDKLKRNLADSDWRVMKHADGGSTDEEYEPYRIQRAAWRAEINEIEKDFHPPVLTQEEIEYAEDKAMEQIYNLQKSEQLEEEHYAVTGY